MGLIKDKTTNYGIDVTYWHIADLKHDFEALQSSVFMKGFVTQDARRNGAAAFVSEIVTISGDDFNPNAVRSDIYAKLKSLDDFSGATDA